MWAIIKTIGVLPSNPDIGKLKDSQILWMQTNMLIDEEEQLAALKGNNKKGTVIEQEIDLSPEEQIQLAEQKIEEIKKQTKESNK